MQTIVDHEKLKVYQDSIMTVARVDDILKSVPKSMAVHSQLDRGATSIPLNISEGNGKFTSADRCHYFDNARGSALECAACLDVLVAKKLVPAEQAYEEKIVLGQIRSNSSDRVYEEAGRYGVVEGD